MHQLAVTGKQAADVAVLIGGQDLRIYRVERDEVMIAQLIQLEKQFWDCVQNNEAPPVDGSDSTALALRALYPQDNQGVLDLTSDADMNTIFDELQKVRESLTEYNAKENILKQRIQERMKDHSFAQFRSGSISWKKSADSSSIDAKALAKDHPELANQYIKTKAGSRRFNVLA
jgi:predicted phage-related endonuclease